MKKDIHPTYYSDAKITCACGNTMTIGSTLKEIRVELCSACHPFYTGKQKLVDSARRVEKFSERAAKQDVASKSQGSKRVKAAKRAAQKAEKKTKVNTAASAEAEA